MQAGMMAVIGIIFILMVMSIYLFLVRSRGSFRSRGKNYKPPEEVKRAEWRDREIARRIASEQEAASERVSLRNETLAYYEAVRQRHLKLEVMERLGMDPDKANIDEMTGMGLDEYLNIR